MRSIVLLLLMASAATAAPVITVRARTQVQIDRTTRADGGVHIAGQLLDDSGGGVAGRTVVLEVDGEPTPTETAAGGRFDAFVTVGTGQHELEVSFDGDDVYDASATAPRKFDVGKESVVLTVTAGDIDSADPAATATLTTSSTDGATSLELEVLVGDPKGALRSVGKTTTGRDGTGTISIPHALLGAPGTKRVVARFAGSDAFNPAEAEDRFQVTAQTQLVDVTGPTGTVKFESDVKLSGQLVGPDNAPVAGELIQVTAGSKKLGDALTRKDGRFTAKFAASELAPGAATVAVVYESRTPWRRGAKSPPMTFTILEPRPVPVIYHVLAFLLTALAVLGYVLVRTRPWTKLAERWRRRRRREESGPQPAIAGEPEQPPQAGLKLARPSLMSTLRRPNDTSFSGRVRDAVKGDPVADARVVLSQAGRDPLALAVDRLGQFTVNGLAPGAWQVEVGSPGYVTERFAITMPHRGELRGVRIDLLPVKERVFALYKDVAARLLPAANLWGVWTPREIFDHVRSRRPAGKLGALTTFVEEIYFSARAPGEEILVAAQANVQAAQAEQSG